ncbi:MAG TPA: hypothetical protein VGR81_13350 [Candidatus Acidoferrales bacterium]|nr:hypothetical protein [Candidatus Acidoferrales bacterium]
MRKLICPIYAPPKVKAVWHTWTVQMQERWVIANPPAGYKSSLLRKPEIVRTDIFIQGLEPDELAMIREALGKGLTPSGFEVVEDILILRLDRNESPKPLQEE